MPLVEPKFDSRTYREILNEVLARIPAHNPEWTNRSDADPGVTILQLFSFLTESAIFRANLIPDRNRKKFLRLLGQGMRAAAAAKGIVTFRNPKGAFEVFTRDAGDQVNSGNVPFRTENGLEILPIEARLYYKRPLTENRRAEIEDTYRKLYASFDLPETDIDFYETAVFEPATNGVTLTSLDISRETKDGALWVALLSRPDETPVQARSRIANRILSLGILPALDEEGCALYPLGPTASGERPELIFELPNTSDERIRYETADVTIDQDPLSGPGIAKISLPGASKLGVWRDGPLTAGVGGRPPSLEETADLDRLITWIRIRSPQIDTETEASTRQLSIPLSWVGINAARVIQRTEVPAEQLPNGDGEPDQTAVLTNKPVIGGETFRLTVNGEEWQEIDDLMAAPPEVPKRMPRLASESREETQIVDSSKVFSLDVEAGLIRFGDGAHGMRPPNGASIQVAYSHGGGAQGMVGIDSINRASNLPPGIKVSNPVPTWGGSEAETVEDAEKNIPALIRHRDRMVSEIDCLDIVKRTPGIDLGRAEILPLFHPKLPRQTSDGVVTVMVIPKNDPEQPRAPRPDQIFLEAVCSYLSPRRILTTEVHVRGPEYIPIWIAVGIDVVPGFDPGPVRRDVAEEVHRFLSPLEGGFEGKAWPLQKVVDILEVAAAVTRVRGVAKVTGARLATATGGELSEVPIEGLELPYLKKILVVEGEPPPIDEVRDGEEVPVDETGEAPQIVPVPVIPEEC